MDWAMDWDWARWPTQGWARRACAVCGGRVRPDRRSPDPPFAPRSPHRYRRLEGLVHHRGGSCVPTPESSHIQGATVRGSITSTETSAANCPQASSVLPTIEPMATTVQSVPSRAMRLTEGNGVVPSARSLLKMTTRSSRKRTGSSQRMAVAKALWRRRRWNDKGNAR